MTDPKTRPLRTIAACIECGWRGVWPVFGGADDPPRCPMCWSTGLIAEMVPTEIINEPPEVAFGAMVEILLAECRARWLGHGERVLFTTLAQVIALNMPWCGEVWNEVHWPVADGGRRVRAWRLRAAD